MAKRIGFSVYKIQVREPYASEWWEFRRKSGTDAYKDISESLHRQLNVLTRLGDADPDTGKYSDDRAVKLIRLEMNEPNRHVAGMLLQGEAGIVRPVYNFDSPDKDPTYTMKISEGALTPLYFRLHLADGRRYGIAILQTFGNQGMKGSLEVLCDRHLRGTGGHLTSKITQLLDQSILAQFAAQGKLQDVILVNRGQTASSRTAMEQNTIGEDGLGQEGDKLELKLHKKAGWPKRTVNKLLSCVNRRENPRELVKTDIGEVDDMLVEITIEGRTQRFSLLNPDDSPIRYDKTSQLIRQSDGLPSWAALEAAADEVWKDVQDIL